VRDFRLLPKHGDQIAMITDEHAATSGSFSPKLISFDVFGTLISVREGSYAAFQSILDDVGGRA
jgi:hypothetical protein